MSRSAKLLLPRQLYSAMVEHAQAEFPNECCGLLAGTREVGKQVAIKHYALVNEAASPVEYLSEPRSMFEADRDMRKLTLEIVAVYHSHPTSAPVPSRTDLERNFSPDVVNLIISLADAEPLMRAWWLGETDFVEADWQLVDA